MSLPRVRPCLGDGAKGEQGADAGEVQRNPDLRDLQEPGVERAGVDGQAPGSRDLLIVLATSQAASHLKQ